MLTIDGEVTVQGENCRVRIILHHADEAGVSKGHGDTVVFFHETENLVVKSFNWYRNNKASFNEHSHMGIGSVD